jgi:ABC-type branched-subunit amino acid transport system substrate-binding protein
MGRKQQEQDNSLLKKEGNGTAMMKYKEERTFPLVIAVFAPIVFLIFVTVTVSNYLPVPPPTPVPLTFLTHIGVFTAADGEFIGVSDGSFAFDTNRPDGNLKRQASDALKKGDILEAKSFWNQGLAQDTNDAEAHIYLEDQRVIASHAPYITLVVATMLTSGSSAVSTGRDDLQGAYIAQEEYNVGFKLRRGLQVFLLIASAGSRPEYAASVAQQIAQIAKTDRTVVGVMGWPFSSYALNAVRVLANAHIPMVSPTASSDALSNISPYFFRVSPSNNVQAIAGARYAAQQLNATRAALFVDPDNSYSQTLASGFEQEFIADGKQIVVIENYTVGKTDNLASLLHNALSASPGPDLIYFAGSAADMSVLLTDLPTFVSNVQLMGGDGLYQLGGYTSSSRAGFGRLHFTAFASPDEWQYLHQQAPTFFTSYKQAFDPDNQHLGAYGYDRPDSDVILSYDAMLALLQGCKHALAGGGTSLSPEMLQQGLVRITGTQAMQGISGQISFGANGDPINKAIVVLYVDPNGSIRLNRIQGCFLVGPCSNSQ